MTVVAAIAKSKKQMERLGGKDFEDLVTVKRFLDKIEINDGHHLYKDVVLHHFVAAKGHTSAIKGQMLGLICDQFLVRLEANEIPVLKSVSIIINTESWEKTDGEFGENEIHMLFGQFEIPLRNAGLSCMLNELIKEWQPLLDYATSYLNPTGQSYSRIWYKIFNSECCNILQLAELLFCLPISNAVVERLFSVMKQIKTRWRSSMGQIYLSHLICIKMGGPSLSEFDAMAAIKLWSTKSNITCLYTF